MPYSLYLFAIDFTKDRSEHSGWAVHPSWSLRHVGLHATTQHTQAVRNCNPETPPRSGGTTELGPRHKLGAAGG